MPKIMKKGKSTFTIEHDGYSIHTIELSKKLSIVEWRKIKNFAYSLNKENSRPVTYPSQISGDHFCLFYSQYGVRITLEYYKSNGQESFYIRMIVNPRRLIDPDSGYLGILPPKEESIRKLKKSFYVLFDGTAFENDIQNYYLSRADLCVNIRCSNRKVFRELIRLLRKTATLKKYTRVKYVDRDKKKQNQYNKHYIRIKCQSQELIIYDKTYQLNQSKLIVDYEKLPKGVLRIEVRYFRKKIRMLERQYGIGSSIEMISKLMETSRSNILDMIERCYPDVPYYNLEDALQKIQNSDFHFNTKGRMSMLLHQMQRKQSLDAAFKYMRKKEIQTEDLMDRFTKLGINPIPIRIGFASKWMPGFPELLRHIENKPFSMELQYPKWK